MSNTRTTIYKGLKTRQTYQKIIYVLKEGLQKKSILHLLFKKVLLAFLNLINVSGRPYASCFLSNRPKNMDEGLKAKVFLLLRTLYIAFRKGLLKYNVRQNLGFKPTHPISCNKKIKFPTKKK